MDQFVPKFKCKYCGEFKYSQVKGDLGIFVPCQCEEARKQRDQDHWVAMERKKQARRKG